MPWKQADIHKDMQVSTSDKQELGHVAEAYEDYFLVRKGIFFPTDRYIPYSAIASVNNDHVQLTMNAADATLMEWKKRPDCERHLGDPTQLMYDRGHGVHDPFDELPPNQSDS